ncbi:MAG: response regulator [Phycisphaerales bacterium]|nr:response regulator [Phycisphaerales bacterium]
MNEPRPRLLLLQGACSDRLSVAQLLDPVFEVLQIRDIEQALTMMRDEHIDALFADAGDFLPLERGLASGHAAIVLNTLGEGVCICNAGGGLAWQNDRFTAYSDEARQAIIDACAATIETFEEQLRGGDDDVSRAQSLAGRRLEVQGDDDVFYEVAVSPVVSTWRDGRPKIKQVVAIVSDVTGARKLQRTIDAIDAAGAELVRIEADAIAQYNAAERLRLLENKIIRYSRDLLNFNHFEIRLLDRTTNKLELVIAVGLSPEAMDQDLYASSEGNGISGYVAATGRSYLCYDVTQDPRYVPGLTDASSSLTVALRLFDRVIGVFNIEAEHVGAFTEDDRQCAEIFARYIAMAVHILDLLVVERYTTNERVTDNIVDRVTEPLAKMVRELTDLQKTHRESKSIVARIDAVLTELDRVRGSVGAVARGPKTILDAEDALRRIEVDAALAGKRILVAEDEPVILDQATKVLAALGCSVTAVDNGQSAIDALDAAHDAEHFDLILSDIKLPDRNGYEVFSAARRMDTDVPVILMTGFGYDPHHSIVRASQEGLQCVLFKPFQAAQLVSEVRQALSPAAHPV